MWATRPSNCALRYVARTCRGGVKCSYLVSAEVTTRMVWEIWCTDLLWKAIRGKVIWRRSKWDSQLARGLGAWAAS